MKPHCKPPANHLQTTWCKAIILHFSFFVLHSAFASVPLSWQVTPRNPAPVAFDRHHGETLEFRCTFTGFGELPFAQAADIRLWYQTSGMAAAWWSVPASVSSNILSATFPPSADPGADRLALFFGAPSNAYASAVLRLRHSPGFTPNILPPPDTTSFEETDPVFRAWLATNDLLRVESDPTVPEWAKADTPPQTMTTNDVCAIVTNETGAGHTLWTILRDGVDVTAQVAQPWWSGFSWDVGETRTNGDIRMTEFVESDEEAISLEWSHAPAGWDGESFLVEYTATRSPITRNFLGLARLADLPPLTNAIPDAAARAVYDVHDLIWDATESILYWHKIRQGHDEYIAVTNIDLTNPVNAAALKAWREANR